MINETDRRCITAGGIQRCVESSKIIRHEFDLTWPHQNDYINLRRLDT